MANALDEQALTGTTEPEIFKDPGGNWHVADAGRGVRYEHLTQNENAEKRKNQQVTCTRWYLRPLSPAGPVPTSS
jgi:hypothetical protein